MLYHRYMMRVTHKSNLYDPLKLLSFRVFFDNEDEDQAEKAHKVVSHLQTLETDALVAESKKIFQWIVQHNVQTHLVYATVLLEFFHSKELLVHKKQVVTEAKQDKSRYVVIYDMDGKVFSKIYNSVREIREDTGKKPSKICKYKI